MEGFGRNETNNLDIYWLQEILNAENLFIGSSKQET